MMANQTQYMYKRMIESKFVSSGILSPFINLFLFFYQMKILQRIERHNSLTMELFLQTPQKNPAKDKRKNQKIKTSQRISVVITGKLM